MHVLDHKGEELSVRGPLNGDLNEEFGRCRTGEKPGAGSLASRGAAEMVFARRADR